MRIKIYAQVRNQVFYVIRSKLGIPIIIHMNSKRSQTLFNCKM